MGSRLVNEAPKWAVLVVYFAINLGLFWGKFAYYQNSPSYFYLRSILGLGLAFARAPAACLNFNCMLILLPVCRNLLSLIRGSMRCCKRSVARPLDKNIAFHKLVAYVICFMTAIHTGAHCFNAENFVNAHIPQYANKTGHGPLVLALTSLNSPYINPVRDSNSNPIVEVLKLLPGWTGVVITLSLILIVSSSTEILRRYYFEIFWFTHHLFIVFFIGVIVHGFQGVVRAQTRFAENGKNDPARCSTKFKEWGSNPECDVPYFENPGAETWKWIVAPLFLYLVERVVRFWRSQQKVVITKVVKHPSRVIELQLKKRGFTMEAGQYIFLHCPRISRFEWHPFTLTSSPEEDTFCIHIRVVGDWTTALSDACSVDDATKLPSLFIGLMHLLAVDGPFGTATEDIFRYDVDVLVGTGIGVTPFASVLKHIWYKSSTGSTDSEKLKKVYLFWICPDTEAFEWFADLLQLLERQMAEQGRADFLSTNIYLTRGWDTDQARNIALHEENPYDAVTGLHQKTHYGRPSWDQIFTQLAQAHQDTRIGLFFCGPKLLSTKLHKLCNQYSSTDRKGTQFVYNKENF